MTTTTGTRERFGSASWHRLVFSDERIPSNAMGTMLAIGARGRWGAPGGPEFQPPVNAIAARMQVEPAFVHSCVSYLLALGYLIDTGTQRNRRQLYKPNLPPETDLHQQAPPITRQPTNGNDIHDTTPSTAA